MNEEKNKTEKEEYTKRVGPLLNKIFEKQKQIIKETTWDCINPSDFEVGEILAKKILDSKLL